MLTFVHVQIRGLNKWSHIIVHHTRLEVRCTPDWEVVGSHLKTVQDSEVIVSIHMIRYKLVRRRRYWFPYFFFIFHQPSTSICIKNNTHQCEVVKKSHKHRNHLRKKANHFLAITLQWWAVTFYIGLLDFSAVASKPYRIWIWKTDIPDSWRACKIWGLVFDFLNNSTSGYLSDVNKLISIEIGSEENGILVYVPIYANGSRDLSTRVEFSSSVWLSQSRIISRPVKKRGRSVSILPFLPSVPFPTGYIIEIRGMVSVKGMR